MRSRLVRVAYQMQLTIGFLHRFVPILQPLLPGAQVESATPVTFCSLTRVVTLES
jgi:hypothetical protein